jgi:hypothetical protein
MMKTKGFIIQNLKFHGTMAKSRSYKEHFAKYNMFFISIQKL